MIGGDGLRDRRSQGQFLRDNKERNLSGHLKVVNRDKNKAAKRCRMHEISCSRAGGYQRALFSSNGLIHYCCVLEMSHKGLISSQALVSLIVERTSQGSLCNTCVGLPLIPSLLVFFFPFFGLVSKLKTGSGGTAAF